MAKPSPLLAYLANRQVAATFDPEDWSLLFAEARSCGLMARVATEVADTAPASMPEEFKGHILAALRQSEALAGDVVRELRYADSALASIGTKVILLKGAAYVAAELPAARGRIFSDLDILVERRFVPQAEGALMLAGWASRHLSDYDRRYYREWSHEIPPMTHLRRGTVIDLHHSLVMPTCRIRVDSQRMVEDAVPIPGEGNWHRLGDEDLVLHAASHLLLNSEFDRGLRDLWDIDILLRHFGSNAAGFAGRVLNRADEVGLGEIVRQAFDLCHHFFQTTLPTSEGRQGGLVASLMRVATGTRHPDTRPRWQAVADSLLLYRELGLRLPPHLLIRHLWHKMIESLKHNPPSGQQTA